MSTCLCCSRGIPVSERKVCPLCGHTLMGLGWWGVDFHWQSRHEAELPFREFWDGLCARHRANHPETVPAEPAPVQAVPGEPAPVQAVPAEPAPVQAIPAEPVPTEPVPAQAVLPEPPEFSGRRARTDRARRPSSHRHGSGPSLPEWLSDGFHPDPARTFPPQVPDVSWHSAGPLPGPGQPGLKRG